MRCRPRPALRRISRIMYSTSQFPAPDQLSGKVQNRDCAVGGWSHTPIQARTGPFFCHRVPKRQNPSTAERDRPTSTRPAPKCRRLRLRFLPLRPLIIVPGKQNFRDGPKSTPQTPTSPSRSAQSFSLRPVRSAAICHPWHGRFTNVPASPGTIPKAGLTSRACEKRGPTSGPACAQRFQAAAGAPP